MIQHTKNVALSIGILLSISYNLAMAKQYGPLTDDMGDIILNDGDLVKADNNGPVLTTIGITSASPIAKVTINGAATIDITSGHTINKPDGIGINLANGNTNNLGSGTEIKVRGNSQTVGLQVDKQTMVIANNLNIKFYNDNVYDFATGISVSDQSNVDLGYGGQIDIAHGSGIAMGIKEGSTVKAEGITINTGIDFNNHNVNAIDVNNASLDLGNNSSINITSTSGENKVLNVVNAGKVTANQLTIMANNASYAININHGGDVDLGSNSYIKTTRSYGSFISAINVFEGHFKANQFTLETEEGYGVVASIDGKVDIGAGSHIITEGTGIYTMWRNATINFKGDAVNRNSITVQTNRATGVQTNAGLINLENTDIVVSGGNRFGGSIGLQATAGGVITGKNLSFKMLEDDGQAVAVYGYGTINLTGETNIDGGSNSGSAFSTVAGDSTITLTGKANIIGNISASGNASLIDLNMDAGSIFTGRSAIDTSTTAKVNLAMTDSTWNMTDNAKVTNLTLHNSTVNFTNSNFTILTTEKLQGDGLFNIHSDIVGQTGDLIVVNGTVTGSHRLNVVNNGSAATDGTETLTVVETGTNQANFSLAHKVELGAYEYGLRASPNAINNMELYSVGPRAFTTTAQASASFLNIGYLTNYIENQTMLQRLGDLRNSQAMGANVGGLWMKGFGGKLSSFAGNSLTGFDMSYTGTQAGIDKALEMNNGNLVIGAMAGFTRTNPNYRGGNGNGKNYMAGLYASYFLENGFYVDTVLKYNSMRNHFSVKDTAGTGVKGTGKTQGISLSTEIGKRFWLAEEHTGFYLEPQAQLSYGYQNGDTINSSNGLTVGLSHYNSVLGRVSGVMGYQLQGENPLNIYLKAGIVREMSGDASFKFNDGNKHNYSFRSNWFDNGIGINMSINKQHTIYAEYDYARGNNFNKQQLDIGYRYNF